MSTPSAVSIKSEADARLLKLFLLATLPLYALDQLTKFLVVRRIAPDEPITVIPGWFQLVYSTNTGAAFGIMKDSNLFFIILSAVALVVIVILSRQAAFEGQALSRVGFSLLTAGVLGNLTDRLIHRHVVDFLDFNLHVPGANPWPAFNVADSCICVAVGCFLLGSWQEMRAAKVDEKRMKFPH